MTPRRRGRREHLDGEAGRSRLVFAHLAGERDDGDAVAQPPQALQRDLGAVRALAGGAQLESPQQDLAAVAALQAHAAADAGYRIDDEPELLQRGSP